MQQDVVLQIQQAKKYFGAFHAVEDVSLSVRRGAVFGFLGPNGAGKTTTIGMILGLIHPTGGQIEVLGERVTPGKNQVLRRVGALVGAPSIVPYLSARDHLRMMARLHPQMPHERIAEVLEQVNLGEAMDRAAGKFSTGMKQRLGLAMALFHKPELLILDEPTNGLDPAGMREIRELIQALAGQGMTVFLSSHLLHEVEQLCDEVTMLNKGRIVAAGRVDELLAGQQQVRVRVDVPSEALPHLQTLPQITHLRSDGTWLEMEGVSSQEVLRHLMAQAIVPHEVTSGRSNLETLFLEVTK